MKTWKIAALAGALGLSVAAHATFYTTEASFLAAIDPTYYLEDFSSFTFGSPLAGDPSWTAPGANGYGWTASAPNGLFSDVKALSTNNAQDVLTLKFAGKPVTAFGGKLVDSDIAGNPNSTGSVTLTTSGGDTLTVSLGSFIGWVGTSSITAVTMTAQGHVDPNTGQQDGNDWIELGHAYTGTNIALVPEPASLAVLGIGALALIRRRRSK